MRDASQRLKRSPYSISKSISNVILHQFIKLRLLWFILVAALFLSGCVHNDVAIKFYDANHGEIVQHIRFKPQGSIHLSSDLNDAIATAWVESLEQRTKALGGSTRHPQAQEWLMTIPFHNAKDLESKFNQLFRSQSAQNSELPTSRLQIKTKNRLMWQRQHLQYDLDLRSLRATLQGNLSESIDLEFKLKTPWWAQSPITDDKLSSKLRKSEGQLAWRLKPGAMNHIEAIFWVPNFVGIGFCVISLMIIGGAIVKILLLSGAEIVAAEMD
ncbi:MAG: DUF3153 domain-containing protein [Timaviella obliquedivisa GSE-PSE-MK23-08B]|jgi:hypothetical protein|nr:DUF3153 domain-containing protein [Timaviella obliquedivisa GSE-PSE-MK23-08B]